MVSRHRGASARAACPTPPRRRRRNALPPRPPPARGLEAGPGLRGIRGGKLVLHRFWRAQSPCFTGRNWLFPKIADDNFLTIVFLPPEGPL